MPACISGANGRLRSADALSHPPFRSQQPEQRRVAHWPAEALPREDVVLAHVVLALIRHRTAPSVARAADRRGHALNKPASPRGCDNPGARYLSGSQAACSHRCGASLRSRRTARLRHWRNVAGGTPAARAATASDTPPSRKCSLITRASRRLTNCSPSAHSNSSTTSPRASDSSAASGCTAPRPAAPAGSASTAKYACSSGAGASETPAEARAFLSSGLTGSHSRRSSRRASFSVSNARFAAIRCCQAHATTACATSMN